MSLQALPYYCGRYLHTLLLWTSRCRGQMSSEVLEALSGNTWGLLPETSHQDDHFVLKARLKLTLINGKSPTGHSVRVHAELAVVHCSLVQTGFQPLHYWSRSRQTKQALQDTTHRGCSADRYWKANLLQLDGLSLTSSLMPVLSSMWMHSWIGTAISLLLWDKCACRGSPYTLWVERLSGGPEGSNRMSESGSSSS